MTHQIAVAVVGVLVMSTILGVIVVALAFEWWRDF
jgi:hypothetical protein